MPTSSPGSSHLGVTDNQKRWLVAGIALNKILVPQIRPFLEQEGNKRILPLYELPCGPGFTSAGSAKRGITE
ncbi:hypothetical protein ABFA07_001282 [Porites harrisoni]